jgi:hypothetical protein
MKTTLNLNDLLLMDAKAFAIAQRTTLTRLIEEGLTLRLRTRKKIRKATALPVFRGKGGLAPHINGLSNQSLWAALEHDA